MDILKAMLNCLGLQDDVLQIRNSDEKKSASTFYHADPAEDELASSILSALFTAEKPGQDLDRRLQNIVHTSGNKLHTSGWYEGLAKRVLDGLIDALQSGAAMGTAMKEAVDRASAVASKFVKEHPVFATVMITIIAIGILAILLPWAVEALGFGELGPVEGENENPPFLFPVMASDRVQDLLPLGGSPHSLMRKLALSFRTCKG